MARYGNLEILARTELPLIITSHNTFFSQFFPDLVLFFFLNERRQMKVNLRWKRMLQQLQIMKYHLLLFYKRNSSVGERGKHASFICIKRSLWKRSSQTSEIKMFMERREENKLYKVKFFFVQPGQADNIFCYLPVIFPNWSRNF